MEKSMKPIIAGNYVSDTNNPIKTPWGLTSNNNKIEYKMIDLNSPERIQDQIKSLNNQLIFDEDKIKRIKHAIKDLNNPLPEDAYSVDELVEYKKWYNQAVKNKLQISQTCKDWFEGIFALLIPFGVDYYKTKYRDTSLYNIKPIQFSIDILKEIAGFVNYFDLDVNTIIYNNLLIRINQKEMTKLKEVNTYTLEELKWYKFWYGGRAVIKPSLDSKFKEALDEESKTEIEFDLDDLKLIKSGADNYYKYHVRDDYKLSIEEDNILDKLDARISFLRKKIIHQYIKDVFNSPIKSSTKDEETVANSYTLDELKWYKFWYDNKCILIMPYEQEIFDSVSNKLSEALDEESKTDVEFDLDELQCIKDCANNYYGVNTKGVEDTDVEKRLDARISFLKNKSSAEDEETVSNAYVEKQEEIWAENHICIYTISDIYWINKWCENILKATDSLAYKCRDVYREIFKITGKHPETTSDNSVDNSIASAYVFFSLKELKEIRNYASMYYFSNEKTVGAKNTLDDINLRIKYLEKQEKMNNSTVKQEKMNNSTENQEEMKCETLYSKKAINQSWEALHKPDTSSIFPSVSQLCDETANAMWVNEATLVNIVRECIVQEYNVEYKVKDGVTFKGYITHGELINYIENGITKLYIRINTPSEEGEDDGTLIINLLEEINLKTLTFKDNTLFLQYKNA